MSNQESEFGESQRCIITARGGSQGCVITADDPDPRDALGCVINAQGPALSAETETATSSSHSVASIVSCRICKSNAGDDLIPSPCRCKGSMGAVHVGCLEEWLTGSSRESCELCEAPFNIVRSQRYGLLPSMWVYLRDHVNKGRLLRSLFFLTVSAANTAVLLGMWIAFVFAELGIGSDPKRRSGLDHLAAGSPVRAALYFFVFTLCLFFVGANTADDLARVHYGFCRPWHRWWRSAVDVRLVVDGDRAKRVRTVSAERFRQ